MLFEWESNPYYQLYAGVLTVRRPKILSSLVGQLSYQGPSYTVLDSGQNSSAVRQWI